MKAKTIVALAVLGCALAVFGAGANGKMIEFSCSGYAGDSTLADFPVLVRLAENSPTGFSYSDMLSSASGAELRFYDALEKALPYEIESWNPSGTSFVWVKVPVLARGSVFTMYYGRMPSDVVMPAEVWTSDYVGVWHFAEDSGAVADATGHGLVASPKGTMTAQVATEGPLGKARVNATSASKGYLEVANDAALNVGADFTVTGWYKMSGLNGNSPIVGRQAGWYSPNGWMFEMTGSYTDFAVRGAAANANAKNVTGSMPSAQNDWVHFALVYKGTNVTVYANGAAVAGGLIDSAKDNDTAMMFGYGATRNHFYGAFDEFRLKSGSASEDWIRAEYAQAGDTFLAAEVWDAPDPTKSATLTVPSLDHLSVSAVKVGGREIPAESDGTYVVAQGASVTVVFAAEADYALSSSTMTFKVREDMSLPSDGRPTAVPLADLSLAINEICASNDEDSGFDTVFGGKGLDWVEIRNRSAVDVDVSGWYLTDSPDKAVSKWTRILGDGCVPAHGYKVVWADKDFANWADSEAHVAISLSTSGEPLLLAAPNGVRIAEIGNFGKQLKGVSCGLVGETSEYGFFTTPTPGRANGDSAKGRPTPLVTLSEPHGYKTAAFQLSLSCGEDPSAEIRYTLDGSSPTTSSTKYTGPIWITKTTVVRAAAPVENSILQLDASATYLFVDDILRQTAENRPAGFPATSENGQSLVYGMSAAIAGSTDEDTRRRLLNGFTNSIRTVSLVIDPKSMFDDATGIYVNPSKDGREWERQTMLEQINPTDDADGFTVSCGIKIRGAFSRGLDYPKHSFHVVFRSEYGAGKLEFPLFGDEGAKSFDRIDLRTSQNCSWANTSLKELQKGLFTLIEDVFSRDTQRDMGQPYNRSRYYNLFINGVYWGIYQTEERVNQYCAKTNNGGREEDYDVVRTSTSYASSTSFPVYTTQTVEGEDASWLNLWEIVHEGFESTHPENYNRVRGLNPDGTRNPAYPVYLNAENLIDYMLVAHWTCNCDTPAAPEGKVNNQAAYRNRKDGEGVVDGFVWHLHDCEYSLGTYDGPTKQANTWGTIRYGADTDDFAHFGPALINRKLMSDPEYRQLFADLAYRHLFRTDATLSSAKAKARFGARMAELDEAIVCEAARWGGGRTREDWLSACDSLMNGFMDKRSSWMKMAYRSAGYTGKYGWYPSIDAPTVCNARGEQLLGGEIVDGTVSLTGTESGTVYYTTDGSDPRLVGGAVSSAAAAYSKAIPLPASGLVLTARVRTSSGEWSALEQVELKSAASSVADSLRFHSFDGVTTAADADVGEWIVLTNLNPTASFGLEGVRIVVIKDGDTEAKCDFVLGAGTTIPAGGSLRLDQAACGWEKITNNKIRMSLYDQDGETLIQTSGVITQKNFATYYGMGGPGGEACLVATSFESETTGADWIASDVVVPPAPAADFYTGVYSEPVTIVDSGDYTLSNATFNAGLVLGSGTYILRNFKGTTNTATRVTSTGTVAFKQAGTFKLTGTGPEPLMTVYNLFVSNGTFKVDYASDTAKAMAVNVTGGFAVESEGTVDVTVGGTQNYGIYVANKNQFCRIGAGGKFKATVNGTKYTALYGNKGSVDAEVEDDSKVRATLSGAEARLFNFAGKIQLKGGDVEVTGSEAALSNKVFKSDKSISVKKGARITVEVPGAGSEAFSCADAFRMEGGHVEVVSADDCVGAETNVVVTGGKFYGRSLQNDVFDTNAGDITIDGGLVLAYTTAQEPTDNPSKTVGSFGFDVNGYQVNVNGGTVVAIGGENLKGNHMPTLAGTQNLFVDEEVGASKYSGKYLSYTVNGTNTTVGLPAIDAAKCTVLFTVPGMPMGAQPQILNAAPETGSIDFHEVYVTEPEPILPFELGETAARPQTDYNGSVVTVRFTGDLPDGVTPAAKVTLDGADYAGTVDAANGEVTFELPSTVVTAGNTYDGVVTVTVGGDAYTKDVTLAQGTFRVHENTGWIRESAATFASTGSWSGDKAAVASGTIGVSNATFTAATVAPTASLVTIASTFDFRAASKKPLDASKRAGLCVVRVGNADRYAYLTAAAVVTNTTVAAKTTAPVAVKVTLDTAANTVSYVVDGVEIGSGAMTAKSVGVSKVGYVGETTVAALTGAYRTEGLDANVAKVGGVEYATVAEALAAGQGQVQLLWDTAWNPSAAGDYTFDKNGFNLVIGGPLAYSVKDNGNGTVTVTVTGGSVEAPAPTSVTMAGDSVKIGVENLKPDLWYALEKTTDLTKPFVIDTTTWTKGSSLLAGEKELVIALGGTEPQAFYRVVVSTTAP